MSQKSKRRAARRRGPPLLTIFAVLGGLALVAVALSALSGRGSSRPAAVEVTGQPRLKVDKELVDLGNIRLGQTVDASFILTNVGDVSLRFEEVPYIEVVEGC
jgi:cell division septal protein FtsQ